MTHTKEQIQGMDDHELFVLMVKSSEAIIADGYASSEDRQEFVDAEEELCRRCNDDEVSYDSVGQIADDMLTEAYDVAVGRYRG